MNASRAILVFCLAGWTTLAPAAPVEEPQTLELTVDGVTRTALVHIPPGATHGNLPLVFVFHGHGGSSRNALYTFKMDRQWPEAISVYPQGLKTPGKLTDPEGLESGWQKTVGDQEDRDLHFFDALLARLEKDHPVDTKRVYATGHSNGGGFTYLLWLARPQVFAAMAPCSGAAAYVQQLTPKPVLLSAGREDPLVKFEWQKMMIAALTRINGCDAPGESWQDVGTLYPSKGQTPLVTYLYDGGHAMDPAEPALIVRFFQEHPVSPTTGAAPPP